MSKILNLLAVITVLCTSCGGEDDSSNQNALLGSWDGVLVQPVFGELITDITISSLSDSQGMGKGTFTSGDISTCDDTQFNCTALFCNFNLSWVSGSGSSFVFDQELLGTSTCGDGIFEIKVVDNNTLNVVWYEEPYPENRATGTLTRK